MPVYYYIVYTFRDILDICCAILLIAIFYRFRFLFTLKSGLIFWLTYLLVSVFSAWLIPVSESSPILQLAAFPFIYLKTPIFIIALCKRRQVSIFITVMLYETTLDILTQTVIFLANLNSHEINYIRQFRFNIVDCLFRLPFLILLFALNKRIIGKNISKNVSPPSTNTLLLMLLSLFCAGLMESRVLIHNQGFEQVVLLSLVILLFILIISLFLENRNKQYAEDIVDLLTHQIEMQIEHYKKLNEQDVELRKFKHDYQNLLLGLQVILEANDISQALDYIENVKSLIPESSRTFDSGNYIADALLNAKSEDAAKHQTQLSFEGFIPTMNIVMTDLCVILSNSLDNAIEACAKIDGEKKIKIESKIENGFWFINIENPVKNPVTIYNNSVYTTKEDSTKHGFGLYNIDRIIQKRGGQVNLSCNDNVFVFDAALKLNSSDTVII